jgi:hypothetical protein
MFRSIAAAFGVGATVLGLALAAPWPAQARVSIIELMKKNPALVQMVCSNGRQANARQERFIGNKGSDLWNETLAQVGRTLDLAPLDAEAFTVTALEKCSEVN